jgi:hypothetical protein
MKRMGLHKTIFEIDFEEFQKDCEQIKKLNEEKSKKEIIESSTLKEDKTNLVRRIKEDNEQNNFSFDWSSSIINAQQPTGRSNEQSNKGNKEDLIEEIKNGSRPRRISTPRIPGEPISE